MQMVQFKPTYMKYINGIQHLGGWKYVIANLLKNNFFNMNSKYVFFDTIEIHFLHQRNYVCNEKWTGIIHWTPKTPNYLSNSNIALLFTNINFIKSLKNCFLIITLSNYITQYLEYKFKTLGFTIPICTLKHPVMTNNILKFDIKNYYANSKKHIMQIGQQMRKLSSIYLINTTSHKKIWLTGEKNMTHCANMLNREINYFNINRNLIRNDVSMLYTNTYEEYDDLLSKNIVFIDLFDAAANNVVIECIIRNTPIIINRIPGVMDYLGFDYPLYFSNLSEINDLLNDNNKIELAYNYLLNMDKTDLQFGHFYKQLMYNIQKYV